MKVKEFEAFVQEKAKMPVDMIEYSFIGLAGETGEAMEWLKKNRFRKDKKFTEGMLLSELGDILHYVQRIGLFYGWTLKDMMQDNVKKLNERYADGKSYK